MKRNSRISGFYRQDLSQRLEAVIAQTSLSHESALLLSEGTGLPLSVADKMSENVVAVHSLPLSIGLNFCINGHDVLVPMAVEEPSVVAAASNAARLIRGSGGFVGQSSASIMTAQIQFYDVPDAVAAKERILAAATKLLAIANQSIPSMVVRGLGAREMEVRLFAKAPQVLVVHVHIDVGDAMGANTVDTVAEAVAPFLHEMVGGCLGLRILTNLSLRRMTRVTAQVNAELSGEDCAILQAIGAASQFAELDPFRAVTHNKGIMNGVDAVALALGQDFRAIEAGAHGFAARRGNYEPLATWTWNPAQKTLFGELEMPLAVGTVGGSTQVHPGVRAAFEILGVSKAGDLAVIMASVGLASNFAALRALVSEGIQKGHMRLHSRRTSDHPIVVDPTVEPALGAALGVEIP